MKLASAAFLLCSPVIASGEKIGNVHSLRGRAPLEAHDHRALRWWPLLNAHWGRGGNPTPPPTPPPKQDVTCSIDEALDFEGPRQAFCADFNKNTRFCITMSDGGELIGLRISEDNRGGTKINEMSPNAVANKMAACEEFAEFVESGCLEDPDAWVWDESSGGYVCRAMEPPMEPLCGVWTVVNDADPIPNADGSSLAKLFSSYNPASVNADGVVVFRARSTGQGGHAVSGKPETGIFVRDPIAGQPIRRLAGRGTEVTDPNNLDTDYIEFPSFPRIAIGNNNVAFRGNHGPVLRYSVVVEGEEPEETRVGNTGLYCSFGPEACDSNEDTQGTCGNLFTAVGKLGAVPHSEFTKFQVPGLPLTAFDVFPGAPAIGDQGIIAFKGNFAVGETSHTGVFVRQLAAGLAGGDEPIYHVASSLETEIPASDCNGVTDTYFGSTATPSVAGGRLVFRGVDNEGSFDSIYPEDAPACGGIYQANMENAFPDAGGDLVDPVPLTALVKIGDPVPDDTTGAAAFKRFGEALSYDGRYASFWGAWSEWGVEGDFTEIKLCCPAHGNKDMKAYCIDEDPNTIRPGDEGYAPPEGCDVGYQVKYVPNKQGIFVVDVDSHTIKTVAKTDDIAVADFLFWNYSGKPPGAGPSTLDSTTDDESDAAEPPRWRSAAPSSLDSYDTALENPRVVYKVKKEDVVGIYLKDGSTDPKKIVETGDLCTNLDSAGHVEGTPMAVDSLALDRDGFRGGLLALTVECAEVSSSVRKLAEDEEEEEEADWGGIYLIDVDAWLDPECSNQE